MTKITRTPSTIQRRAAYEAHRTMCESRLKFAKARDIRSALIARIAAYAAILETVPR